ncbi:hypothetical protein I6F07_24075 [Ensifer sp. IC4062]|nr:hypothetical protein [Ensifer sp. IC4062]MCA1443243.1 hypothetical protein [Ensifer sp. IC4062]
MSIIPGYIVDATGDCESHSIKARYVQDTPADRHIIVAIYQCLEIVMSRQQQDSTAASSNEACEGEVVQNTPVDEAERLLDEALDETFPASDPISSLRFTPGN